MIFQNAMRNDARPVAVAVVTTALLAVMSACTTETGVATALDGKWLGTYTSTTKVASGRLACTDGYGGLTIAGGQVSGEATNPYGASYTVTGKVVGGTGISADFNYRGQSAGSLQGSLVGDRLAGTFANTQGCQGTWTAVRQ